ncbi:MAG: 2-amino-4-hydroxy-6-hydroxymethyldihydropteridine diphosphokinase [Bacillota bacterium]
MMQINAYIGLGSNQGNREYYLRRAVELLDWQKDIKVTGLSSIYETEPFGYLDQEKFLNMVVKIETVLNPHRLLETALRIENHLGRIRLEKWGPRIIDIDILLYGDMEINSENLILPHPGLTLRAFVLVPLLEIDADLTMPNGQSLKVYQEHLIDDVEGVKFYKNWFKVKDSEIA